MQFTTRDILRVCSVGLITVITLSLLFILPTGAQMPRSTIVPPEVELAQLEAQAKEVGAYIAAVQKQQIIDYVGAVQHQHVIDYVAAVQEAERIEAAKAIQSRPSRPASNNPTTVSGACGGATNGADQFINRESGGNPNVYNSGGSGAWGCYQIMPGTWAGAGCNEFGAYGSASAAAQAQCASRLPMSAWGG